MQLSEICCETKIGILRLNFMLFKIDDLYFVV